MSFPSSPLTLGDAPTRACSDPAPPANCGAFRDFTQTDYEGWATQDGINERMELVADPSGSGKVVLQMDVYGTDDADAFHGVRVSAYKNGVHPNGATDWSSFGVYIPVGYQYADTWSLFYQIKEPNFSNASFALELAGTGCSPSVAPRNQLCWVKKIGGTVRTHLMQAQEGHWHYIVQNTGWSNTGSGFNKVWIGIDAMPDTSQPPAASSTGQTLATSSSTGRENLLIYRDPGSASQHQTAYFCGLRVAVEPESAKALSNCPLGP